MKNLDTEICSQRMAKMQNIFPRAYIYKRNKNLILCTEPILQQLLTINTSGHILIGEKSKPLLFKQYRASNYRRENNLQSMGGHGKRALCTAIVKKCSSGGLQILFP